MLVGRRFCAIGVVAVFSALLVVGVESVARHGGGSTAVAATVPTQAPEAIQQAASAEAAAMGSTAGAFSLVDHAYGYSIYAAPRSGAGRCLAVVADGAAFGPTLCTKFDTDPGFVRVPLGDGSFAAAGYVAGAASISFGGEPQVLEVVDGYTITRLTGAAATGATANEGPALNDASGTPIASWVGK